MGIWNILNKKSDSGSGTVPPGDKDRGIKLNKGLKEPSDHSDQSPVVQGTTDYNAASVELNTAPMCDSAPPPRRTIKPIIEADTQEDSESAENNIPEAAGRFKFLSSALSRLTPRQKQRLLIISVFVSFMLMVVTLVSLSNSWQKEAQNKRDLAKQANADQNSSAGRMKLLSERVERDLWVEAEGQNIRAIQKTNDELQAQINSLRTELEAKKEESSEKKEATPKNEKDSTIRSKKNASAIPLPPIPNLDSAQGKKFDELSRTGPPPIPGKPGKIGSGMLSQSVQPVSTIRIIEDERKNKGDKSSIDDHERKKKDRQDEWLSTGSFMKAVLLNGIDAPTSNVAQSEPYPVLMSITDLANLPNRFKVDMRECFIIGAGYGNLSDERAYIRTEKLSCVKKNGLAVDFDLAGHVIGEDGKLGVRGRLVSKQGQQIAMALFAGTLGGFSSAMKPSGSVTLDISSDGSTTATRANVGDVMASAGLGGAGSALDRVAQYFLKMAEKIYPVIEIDAGRTIEVVVLQGRSIAAQNTKSAELTDNTVADERRKINDLKTKK